MTQTTSSEVGARLRAAVRGRVWQQDDDGYDDARRVWNGAVDRRPAVVVRCADADDVRTALLVARESGAPLSVRGGGHDWAGRALGDGGVVLDLSALRGVEVDPACAAWPWRRAARSSRTSWTRLPRTVWAPRPPSCGRSGWRG